MNAQELSEGLRQAIHFFWTTRRRQHRRQGTASERRDAGTRGAVTGGAQLNGMVRLVARVIGEAGLPGASIYFAERGTTYLPGFFRPHKAWDLLVVAGCHLLACIEFKSQVGSFGNNFNNRTEEALGSATDLWTAYRDGAFRDSPRPWLGYFMLLEDAPKSTTPVKVYEPHFPVFHEFRDASYAKRYELLCLKLVRERLYDAACFLMSEAQGGMARGDYREPCRELSFVRFAASLASHVGAHAKVAEQEPADGGGDP